MIYIHDLQFLSYRAKHTGGMYQKSQSYDVQLLRYRVMQVEFLVILGHFLPFQPHDNPENQNFKIEKKKKKQLEILHIAP